MDNQTVAQLLNLRIRWDNPLYEENFPTVRENTYLAYSRYFDSKGPFLSCHDWRPREYNALADGVCNWVLAAECDVTNLDLQEVAQRVSCGAHLQVHSDGGYLGNKGAYAAVFLSYVCRDGMWKPEVLGYCGVYTESVRSAFHAETMGADIAIRKALEIGELIVQL